MTSSGCVRTPCFLHSSRFASHFELNQQQSNLSEQTRYLYIKMHLKMAQCSQKTQVISQKSSLRRHKSSLRRHKSSLRSHLSEDTSNLSSTVLSSCVWVLDVKDSLCAYIESGYCAVVHKSWLPGTKNTRWKRGTKSFQTSSTISNCNKSTSDR